MTVPLPEVGPAERVRKTATFERVHESLVAALVHSLNRLDAWTVGSDCDEECRLVFKLLHQPLDRGDVMLGSGGIEIKGHIGSNLCMESVA